MSVHAFADESKQGAYYLAAAVLRPHRLAVARTQLRALCLPGQQRVHFAKEQPARRREIAGAICRLGVEVWIYDAGGHRSEREARTACLDQLVADLAARKAQRLVLEQDDSLVGGDRTDLWAAVRKSGATAILTYEHLPPRSEPLLWIADAAVWC